MKKISIFIVLIFTLFSLIFADSYTKGASYVFSFLRNNINSKNFALAGTNISFNDGIYNLGSNPAAIEVDKFQFITGTYKAIDEITYNYLGFTLKINENFTSGLYINGADIELEKRTTSTIEPEIIFDAHQYFSLLALSYKYQKNFNIGIAMKYVYEKIDTEDHSSICYDIGAQGIINNINYGFSLLNIGKKSKMINENEKLPFEFKFGLGKKINFKNQDLKFMLNITKPVVNNFGVELGSEYSFYDSYFLRIGYKSNNQSIKYRTGLGYVFNTSIKKIKLYHSVNLAYGFSENDLNDQFILDYNIKF